MQRSCLDLLHQPDRRVFVTGGKPVTEADSREALVAEQNGDAPPRAVAGDAHLDLIHPPNEGQALLGLDLRSARPLGGPPIAEKGLDAGTLPLQACMTRGI
jgi:hypothetical protein